MNHLMARLLSGDRLNPQVLASLGDHLTREGSCMDGKTGMDCMLMRGSQQPSAGNWSSLPDVTNDSPQWLCLTPVSWCLDPRYMRRHCCRDGFTGHQSDPYCLVDSLTDGQVRGHWSSRRNQSTFRWRWESRRRIYPVIGAPGGLEGWLRNADMAKR